MSILKVKNLTAAYGDFQALFGIDLEIDQGETVAIIGSNGAGKSTFLKSVAGLLMDHSDDITFKGEKIGTLPAEHIVKRGLALVPEGRRLFPSLTVEENLLMGGYNKRKGSWSLERVYELFPILKERRKNPGTALSGGQQQMVAIGRGLMSSPDILLCDEISLGLAPTTVKDIYEALPKIQKDGTAVLLVEQDINRALSVSDRIYCFQEGRVSLEGKPDSVSRDEIKAAYFGM